MNDGELLELSEHVDRLITVDFHTRRFVIEIYNDALRKLETSSLTYRAGNSIVKSVKENDTVLILAGFPTFDNYVAEQDGIVGAAFFARTVAELLNLRTIIFTDKSQADMTTQTLMATGFTVVNKPEEVRHKTQTAVVGVAENETFEPDPVIDEFSPSLVLAIERPSRNSDGKYMSMKGLDLSYKVAQIDKLIDAAKARKILTVGIGDGGNEAGLGLIHDSVYKRHPNGRVIASSVATDELVFASASNLGAYGLSAVLSASYDDLYAFPSKETLRLMLIRSALVGLHNGPPLWLDPGTDGIPLDLEIFILESLRRMIWERLNPHFPKFY
ncbi:MAG: DUF4392 domain-containing protein [Nitrososphaerota archaeon]